ncbi:hypothetical protein [Vibrio mediterranei]|nr:hypothetical protein [Vibrio mediterranei]
MGYSFLSFALLKLQRAGEGQKGEYSVQTLSFLRRQESTDSVH